MIDRAWEEWAAARVPDIEMINTGLDPSCDGCRIEWRTQGKRITFQHSCARGGPLMANLAKARHVVNGARGA